MADYVGITELVFGGVGFGNKRASLLRIKITNYNQSGIPLTPSITAVGSVIEAIILCAIEGTLDDTDAPYQIAYDKVNGVGHLYNSVGVEIPTNANIYSSSGPILLLVIGA